MFRDQLNEDRIRAVNRMHREMKIYFSEYKEVLGKVDGSIQSGTAETGAISG
jgi:hypothetical protein